MEGSGAVVDFIAFAQRIQGVLAAGVQLARHRQRVGHLAQLGNQRLLDAGQLGIQKAHVERRVVNDQLSATDVLQEIVGDFGKLGFVFKVLEADAMHLGGALIDFALGMNAFVESIARDPTADHFHAGDLDDAMPLSRIEAGGLGIENDQAAHAAFPFCRASSTPRLAN